MIHTIKNNCQLVKLQKGISESRECTITKERQVKIVRELLHGCDVNLTSYEIEQLCCRIGLVVEIRLNEHEQLNVTLIGETEHGT